MAQTLNWQFAENDPEAQLRLRPLREQWEARGPGMMAYVRRRMSWIREDAPVVVELTSPGTLSEATIVRPDKVQFVAYLANPLEQLPEVVRLAWMLTCAQVPAAWSEPLVPAALIPLLLEAGEYVELNALDTPTVSLALRNWLPNDRPQPSAEHLFDWWLSLPERALREAPIWLRETSRLQCL
jgi:hypothetical protein